MSLIAGVGDFGLGEILTEGAALMEQAANLREELNSVAVPKTVESKAAFTSQTADNLFFEGYQWQRKTGAYTANNGTIIGAGPGVYYERQYDNLVNVKWFGAKGDGVTDDLLAFQAAISWLKNSRSIAGIGQLAGTVFVPRGIYNVSARIVVPNKVRLLGEGSRISEIRPHSSFSSGSTGEIPNLLVELSERQYGNKVNTFANGLENISLDMQAKAGLIGVYSEEINEQSGLRNFLIRNLQHIGIQIKATNEIAGVGPQNFYIEKGEIIFATGSSNGGVEVEAVSKGIQIDINSGTFQALRDISIVGKNSKSYGIDISSASGWAASSIHLENVMRGFSLAERGPVFAFSIMGVNVQNICPVTIWFRGIQYDSYGYQLAGIRSAADSAAVQDFRNQSEGFERIPGPLGYYAVGREPYRTDVKTARTVISTSSQHERRSYRSESRSPLPTDIAPGQWVVWYNSTDDSVRVVANLRGTIIASAPMTQYVAV